MFYMLPGGLGCVGCCVSDVWVLFRWCFADVSGMSRRRLCDVSNVSQRCFSDVLVMFFAMSRFCFGGVSVMSR